MIAASVCSLLKDLPAMSRQFLNQESCKKHYGDSDATSINYTAAKQTHESRQSYPLFFAGAYLLIHEHGCL